MSDAETPKLDIISEQLARLDVHGDHLLSHMATSMSLVNPKFDTFTNFPQLPAELQLKIWKHTMEGGRIVKIIVDRYRFGPNHQLFYLFCSPTPTPAVLQINRQWRREFLQVYRRVFGNRTFYNQIIYLDPENDTVFLSTGPIEEFAYGTAAFYIEDLNAALKQYQEDCPLDLAKIKKVAIQLTYDLKSTKRLRRFDLAIKMKDATGYCNNAREVTLVVSTSEYNPPKLGIANHIDHLVLHLLPIELIIPESRWDLHLRPRNTIPPGAEERCWTATGSARFTAGEVEWVEHAS